MTYLEPCAAALKLHTVAIADKLAKFCMHIKHVTTHCWIGLAVLLRARVTGWD